MHQSYFEQSLYLNDPLLTYLGTYLTLASVKLLIFEQPDSDLDSLLHKTDERDSLFWSSKTFSLSRIKVESDDSVVLFKNSYYLKTAQIYL